jgi:DNA-binding XRE family transcriptional regulator
LGYANHGDGTNIMNNMPARKRVDKKTPLYAWRIARNITQTEAAELFGISFMTYRRLESLKALPRTYALAFQALKIKYPA